LILEKFKTQRERYNYYMNDKQAIDKALEIGARKARNIAAETLNRVRQKLGFEKIY